MTLEEFRILAQGIQGITLAFGALLGGIWALFRVIQSNELEKAKLETEKIKQEFFEKQGVNISIDFKLGKPIGQYLPGFITVEVNYEGRESFQMYLGDFPMRIGLVTEHDANKRKHKLIANLEFFTASDAATPFERPISQVFLPNSKRTFSFYHLFQEEGIYLLSFVHDMPKSISKHIQQCAVDERSIQMVDSDRVNYSDSCYVQVVSSNKANSADAKSSAAD